MVGKGVTDSKVLETVYISQESFCDSSINSVSSSGNETDDTAVVDEVINHESDDEEEILHPEFM
jgi:hypothetical protein